MAELKLAGRNCMITGASRGLGRVLAEQFWHAGASLLLVARDASALEQVAGGLADPESPGQQVRSIPADLEQPGAVAELVARARERIDRLSVLVNNAGILGPTGPIWDNPWPEWERALRINLLAPAELCAAALPWIGEHAGGKIINLSGGGATGPRPNVSAYATAKTGLVRLTEVLAHEAAPLGVAVNAIAPGALPTQMLDEVLAAGPERVGDKEFAAARKGASKTSDAIERAAQLAVFLASSESDGITGRLISAIWDDWSSLPQHLDELSDSDGYTLRRIVPHDRRFDW